MTKLNVAVIGLGNMGSNHARNYTQLPDLVNLVAVCDMQQEVTDKAADLYKCKGYTDLDEMLANEKIDAVSLVAPTKFHYELAKKIMNKGIHILIEKPITNDLANAQELIDLAKAKKLTLMVGHIERFNPAVQKLKEIVDSGAIGKITSILAKRVGAFPAQIKDANVIIDLAVHDIDIISHLLGKQPDQINGNAGRALINGREDYAEIFLTYGDQNGFIQVNWITPIRIRNLAITGTKGYLEMNYITQEIVMYESNYSQDCDNFGDFIIKFGAPNKKDVFVEKKEPLKSELIHFLECVKTGATPYVTGQQAMDALDIALTVMKKMNMR
jgi:UDP-N-acetylglucosamine 3-dehydrogenase